MKSPLFVLGRTSWKDCTWETGILGKLDFLVDDLEVRCGIWSPLFVLGRTSWKDCTWETGILGKLGFLVDDLEGKAEGQRSAVWIRARLQDQLSQLGYFLQRHAGKVLFLAIVALATFCVALKSAQVHSKAEQLWVQGRNIMGVRDPGENLISIQVKREEIPVVYSDTATPKHRAPNKDTK
ncbi:Protein patched [Eufriesea mexicana]|uniref:Protein patched n=1 Tax=Eufriesea mexicana TaxID=516756 RepID=A0A310SM84_9HYME|nr:Protein patched [Eufriesea mexicana]